METKLYHPNLSAQYLTKSKRLKVFDGSLLLINKVVEEDNGYDVDFWYGAELGEKVWDFNLYKEGKKGKYSLCMYPVENNELNASVWQTIPLTIAKE